MITIKRITLSELPELQKISRQTFLDTFGSDNSAANMQDYLDHAYGDEILAKELTDSNSFFFFAEDSQQILGYLKLNINQAQTESQGPTALEIERIYVNKGFKHQGNGTKLFQKAIEVAKNHDKSEIWLGVWENNAAALKFYHKLGFEQIGDNSLIGHNVVIATINHDLDPKHRGTLHIQSVKLANNTWIGSNATILAGVTVGENSVVAAGAVVTKDVPANTVVAGTPAKVVKHLEY